MQTYKTQIKMKKTIAFLLILMPFLGISQAKFGGNSVAAARATLKNSSTYTLTYVDGIFYLVSTTSSFPIAFSTVGATGTGNLVYSASPILITPNLGTPSVVTLTNATGLPVSTGISGLGTGVATFLATPSSANLLAALTTKTGTGNVVFNTSPSFSGDIAKNDANGYMIYANRIADGGNYGLYYDSGSADVRIYTNSNSRLSVNLNGNVAIGGLTANANAILDIQSTTKAMKLPVMTAAQASAITASAGFMLYVTDTNGTFTSVGFWGYTTSWQKLNN